MNIIMRKTEELIPYGRNQKKHDDRQVQSVANSIKRFGWQQPIVVDKKDVVVIGHCRLLAAKKLNLKEVPVVVADNLSEDEIRELRIADNKTNESAWDLDALKIDLQELDIDFTDFGFNEFELIELQSFEQEEPQEYYRQDDTPYSDAVYGNDEENDYDEIPKEEIDAYRQNAEERFTTKRVIITYENEVEEAYIRNILHIKPDEPVGVVYNAATVIDRMTAENNEGKK